MFLVSFSRAASGSISAHFPTSPSLYEVHLCAFIVASCVSGVIAALLLPELLSSLGWWALSLCLGSLETQAPLLGVGCLKGSRGPQAPLLCVVVLGSWTPLLQIGVYHGHLGIWKDGAPGPLPLLPSYLWPQAKCSWRPELCVRMLLGCLWLWAQLLRSEGRDCAHPLHCFHNSVFPIPIHPSLDVLLCRIFSVLLFWAEESLLSCGCFIGCRLKGKDKGSFSLGHVSDVTL